MTTKTVQSACQAAIESAEASGDSVYCPVCKEIHEPFEAELRRYNPELGFTELQLTQGRKLLLAEQQR